MLGLRQVEVGIEVCQVCRKVELRCPSRERSLHRKEGSKLNTTISCLPLTSNAGPPWAASRLVCSTFLSRLLHHGTLGLISRVSIPGPPLLCKTPLLMALA